MNDIGSGAVVGPAVKRDGLRFLCCPACRGALAETSATGLACAKCGTTVAQHDAIIDFVAGAMSTALDDIDYDQRYAVNLAASLHLYEVIARTAGAKWPASFGDAVEIGCGTGGFSMAFLSRAEVDHAVLTDVSVKMLQICQARLQRMQGLMRVRDPTLVTFSGTETCLAPAAFDTCYGTAVLHHIIDVPTVLTRIHELLKPGGRAFFMEPALPFHHALTSTMADILAVWSREGTVPEDLIVRAANWVSEIRCNVTNTGDVEVLADREDKHQFIAERVEAMARAAGFTVAEALPAGPDPTGADTIGVYLGQVGIDQTAFARLQQIWPTAQQRHFGSLAKRDQAPSYLFWLEKGDHRKPIRQGRARTPQPLLIGDVPLRMWLELRIETRGAGAAIVVSGWCVAAEQLRAIELSVGPSQVRLPIWIARLDVLAAVNADAIYPNLHALCSGIQDEVPLAAAPRASLTVDVAAVGVGDGRLKLQTVTLEPDGRAQQIHISIRAGDR